MNFSVEVLESITKVKREYWDELFDDPIFSYDWLLAFEKCGPLRIYPRHIMATNKNKIVALLPCFLQYEELYSTIEDRILGRLRPWSNRIGFRISPALIAYSPLMYKSTIGISEHKYQKELIIKLLRTMDEILIQSRPIVSKRWLLLTAGLMWSAVGIMLMSRAFGWLKPLGFLAALPFTILGLSLIHI